MPHGVTFNFGSAKVCSPSIFETCFSYGKDVWITATDYYMYFYTIVLFPLTAILQLINFIASCMNVLYVLCVVFTLNAISPYTTGLKALFKTSDCTGTAPTHK